jgi:hypothetical protein
VGGQPLGRRSAAARHQTTQTIKVSRTNLGQVNPAQLGIEVAPDSGVIINRHSRRDAASCFGSATRTSPST